MQTHALALFSVLALPFQAGAPDAPEEADWPRTLSVPEAEIVVYQPQLETFDANALTARAACSVTPAGSEAPVFGAFWMRARIETDRSERLVRLLDLDVTDVRFPNAQPDKVQRFREVVEKEILAWRPVVSLDRILTALELVDMEKKNAAGLATTPPRILFVDHPAVLVVIDGEPELQAVGVAGLMRVVNTPSIILFEPKARAYFLFDGSVWLTSAKVEGPWQSAPDPPDVVAEFMVPSEASPAGDMPEMIVVTEPTELVTTDGQPKYTPLDGTGLLYLANTESDVFVEIDSQRTFVLLSGRWYTAPSMQGAWSYVPPGELPGDFASIDPDSPKGEVLASVPGTEQAIDAVHEAYIPQTAAIDREKATVAVSYEGDPAFEPIEGTEMKYAANTHYSVVQVGDAYYCCHEGAWYVSNAATGPWVVCASVPEVIYTIPPSHPYYNVTYVYVYDSTPDVVYVGYTPGYVDCFVAAGVVVYGTGYRYPCWYGGIYYARPVTYGFGVRYNPYSGGWAVGYRGPHGGFVVGQPGGWWGVGGYNRYYGDIDASRTVTTPRGTWQSDLEIERDWDGDIDIDRDVSFEPNQNVYDRQQNREQNRQERPTREPGDRTAGADREGGLREGGGARGPGEARAAGTDRRANDVYADREGNVFRGTDQGWQRREGQSWSPPERSSPVPDRTTPDRSAGRSSGSGLGTLDRQRSARERGSLRTQRSRSSGRLGGRRGGRGR